jgi:hypothetical protein
MTRRQQVYYRGELWPAACRVQGWDPADDEKRRAVTRQAARKINPNSQCTSTTHLNQDQITALFKLLVALANPDDVAAQRASENPVETKELDERKRLIHVIDELCKKAGFHRHYVRAIAHWNMRQAQVSEWEDLPADKLRRLLITVESRAARRPIPKRDAQTGIVSYEMRPRTPFKTKTATA